MVHSTSARRHLSQAAAPSLLHLTLLFLQFKHAACLDTGVGDSLDAIARLTHSIIETRSAL
jgi:hypothetical protein